MKLLHRKRGIKIISWTREILEFALPFLDFTELKLRKKSARSSARRLKKTADKYGIIDYDDLEKD